MEISSILSSSNDTAFDLQNKSKKTSSFESCFVDASSSSDSTVSSSTSSNDLSNNAAVQAFMNYAKETPAQRMFDSWLTNQNVTEQQYNAMTPAQQQKLINEFEAQLKEKLKSEIVGA